MGKKKAPGNNASVLYALLLLLVIFGIGWNYWLPTAEDYLNLRTRPEYPPNIDFFAYYNAGNRFSDGVNPYYWADTDPQNGDFSDFLYPPSVLPLFELLSKLDYTTARYAWLGIYASAFLLAFLAALWIVQPEDRSLFTLLSSFLLLTSYPLLLHIRNGQMDVFIISLILISLGFYHRTSKLSSAILLAAAALIKVSPALLLIYFLLYRRDFRFAIYFVLSSTAMVLLSLIRVPVELYIDYVINILPVISRGTSYWLNQSIIKFIPEGNSLASVISFSGLAGFSLFSWIRSRTPQFGKTMQTRRNAWTDFLMLYLNLLIILAFAGKIWSMAYVWMILPSAILLTQLTQKRTASILIPATLFILMMNSKVYGFPVLDSLNLVGNLLLTILLIRITIKSSGVESRPFQA